MQSYKKSILITGGAGFIGSHVVRLFVEKHPEYKIYNLDALTYAGNLANLRDIENATHYQFIKADITDFQTLKNIFEEHQISDVIHLAAESHVDRSIENPISFILTNVVGTTNLLNCANYFWKDQNQHLFYHISTDEVYGSLGETGYFTESTAYDPRSPYSASKASSDHIVRAFYHTYKLPIIISNCSNNYGPNQFPEKLLPLIINNILHRKELPVYGTGENVRDWLWVGDHAEAIHKIFHEGKVGSTYNLGGDSEMKNLDLVHMICDLMDLELGRKEGSSRELIRFVKDRQGHDVRYAIDYSKVKNELGWQPKVRLKEGLQKTIQWYLNQEDWLKEVTSGEYKNYYKRHYLN